jgi:anti-anti-sigma factor
MNIQERTENDIMILQLEGKLDTSNYSILEKKLEEAEKSHKNILLDLRNMNYISSSGLRVFLMYLKRLNAAGGKLMLSNMQDNVKEIFNIAGFTSIFEIYDNASDAIK